MSQPPPAALGPLCYGGGVLKVENLPPLRDNSTAVRGLGTGVAAVVCTYDSAGSQRTDSVSVESPEARSLHQTVQNESQKKNGAEAEQGEGRKKRNKSQTGADRQKQGTPRGLAESVGGAVSCEGHGLGAGSHEL